MVNMRGLQDQEIHSRVYEAFDVIDRDQPQSVLHLEVIEAFS